MREIIIFDFVQKMRNKMINLTYDHCVDCLFLQVSSKRIKTQLHFKRKHASLKYIYSRICVRMEFVYEERCEASWHCKMKLNIAKY